jgi:homoserine kinase type II
VAVEVAEGTAALLTWVEGEELVGSLDDVGQIGRILARAHSVLREHEVPGAPAFDWVDGDASHLDVEPWVRPAVLEAVAEWESTRGLVPSWGYLHGDPAPEVFRHDRVTNIDGIIDWAGGIHGPLLYDLASASMYVGDELTPALVEAYAEGGVVPRPEIDRGLHALQRYRYAVQADYFARRLHANDVTGIDGPDENWKGLRDARAMLGA